MLEWNVDKNGNMDPTDYMSNSRAKAWWKCRKCGHEWQAAIGSRTRGRGCPRCAGKAHKMHMVDDQVDVEELEKE